MVNPFDTRGVWLRCALHAHTTNSDGELPPPFLVRHYDRAGFDVLAITDHWVRTDEPSTEGLVVIPSAELNARLDEPDSEAHVLALGVDAEPEQPAGEFPTLTEAVGWIEANGGLPYLAHPYWSGLRTAAFESCAGLLGLEIYNAGCEIETGRGLATVHWDEWLEGGRPRLAIAADDSHHPGFDSSRAWTWVRAAERSPAAVLAALRTGASYCSTGPRIESLSTDGRAVEIRCEPARRITLMTGKMRGSCVVGGRLGYAHGGEVLERDATGAIVAARLVARRTAPYARVEVEGAAGGTAWTNPLWA